MRVILHFLNCFLASFEDRKTATLSLFFWSFVIIAPFVILPQCSFAQKAPYSPRYSFGITPDSMERFVDYYFSPAKDTTSLDRLERWASKHKLTAKLCDLLLSSKPSNVVRLPSYKIRYPDWQKHEGKIIGKIDISTFDVFGKTINDSLAKTNSWAEKIGNALHAKTKSRIVRNRYLLFEEGDKLSADLLKDNERILRQVRAISDARIYVRKRESSDTVDIQVITQDLWSLIPDARPIGTTGGWVELEERNFLGYGHQIAARAIYHHNSPQQWGKHFRLRTAYLGKSLTNLEADFLDTYDSKNWMIGAIREFVSPEMRWAGGASIGYLRRLARSITHEEEREEDDDFFFSYMKSDFWGGYAIPVKLQNDHTGSRSRLILASRYTNYHFLERPLVSIDSNQIYQHQSRMLWSVGLSTRDYYRDYMIFGFGRTEDIPKGQKIVFTLGKSQLEWERRTYGAIEMSQGQPTKKGGYLRSALRIGTFLDEAKNMEQGVAQGEFLYFSPLLHWKKWHIRHFFRGKYTKGFNRAEREFTDISNRDGIWGMRSDELRGTEVALLGTETTFFTPWNFLDFKWAIFTRLDFGMTSFDNNILASNLFQGYNIGFRLYNERLTFRTIQFRLGFYTGFDEASHFLRYVVDDVPRLQIRDFDIEAPNVIDFHQGVERGR